MSQVFISYPRADRQRVDDYVIPMIDRLGLESFRDVDQLRGGRFQDQLRAAIKESDALLVVVSRNALNSEWIEGEIDYARKHDKLILPLLFDGVDARYIDLRLGTYEQFGMRTADERESTEKKLRRTLNEEAAPAATFERQGQAKTPPGDAGKQEKASWVRAAAIAMTAVVAIAAAVVLLNSGDDETPSPTLAVGDLGDVAAEDALQWANEFAVPALQTTELWQRVTHVDAWKMDKAAVVQEDGERILNFDLICPPIRGRLIPLPLFDQGFDRGGSNAAEEPPSQPEEAELRIGLESLKNEGGWLPWAADQSITVVRFRWPSKSIVTQRFFETTRDPLMQGVRRGAVFSIDSPVGDTRATVVALELKLDAEQGFDAAAWSTEVIKKLGLDQRYKIPLHHETKGYVEVYFPFVEPSSVLQRVEVEVIERGEPQPAASCGASGKSCG